MAAEATRLAAGGLPTAITEIGEASQPFAQMDALLWGRSALPCYEPLFGYRLEMFPAGRLHPGPIFDQVDGATINLADPRCYLALREKDCAPGSPFKSDNIGDALAVAAHRPLRWEKPVWQRVAEVGTLASLAISAWILLMLAGRYFARQPA
jgi:hypothetical protein